jgi:hypothetical protein
MSETTFDDEEIEYIDCGDLDLSALNNRGQENAERRAVAIARELPVWKCRCVDCGTLVADTPIETETIACGSRDAPHLHSARRGPDTPPPIENGRKIVLTEPRRLGVREWTLVASAPWRNRFGREVGVLTWRSTCRVCSAPFTQTTSGVVTHGKGCAALRVTTCAAHRQR